MTLLVKKIQKLEKKSKLKRSKKKLNPMSNLFKMLQSRKGSTQRKAALEMESKLVVYY